MEKKNKLKIDYFVIPVFVLFFLSTLIFEYLLKSNGSLLSVSAFTYWLFLIFWIYIIFRYHIKSLVSFVLSFLLFSISSVLVILGLIPVGEVIMKHSFIFLFLGVFQSLIEFLRRK